MPSPTEIVPCVVAPTFVKNEEPVCAEATDFCPNAILLSPVTFASAPIATPDVTLLPAPRPIDTASVFVAIEPLPIATEPSPLANDVLPIAKALFASAAVAVPIAIARCPNVTDPPCPKD
ncbi:hypothetical protein AVENLUH5627_00967 [Acinetobacter venetianus]|uniref:Uncharacterized protein n=1 Tax=Acinetobacter venetianus TaxID=52133 RepID=A0A150I0P4_9GAMM|nr:hypothetical protein AVENLUH5627_00967 [Acinetobacter venetianus]